MDIFGILQGTAFAYGIKPGVLESFADQESGFDPSAIGDGGRSRGLFQIWEPTATRLGISDFEDLFIPEIAADKAAFLLILNKESGYDGLDAIAAYNSGTARKDSEGFYINSQGVRNVQAYVDSVTTKMLSRGINPAKESLFK